jgi:hypothetical protein
MLCMLCRLCSQERTLVRAHVIPEAFFRKVRVEGATPLLISGVEGQYNRSSPIGVYDGTILCPACEGRFQQIDDYGIKVLLQDFDSFFRLVTPDQGANFYESDSVDQDRLLRFLVATLWRASVSTHDFYHRVSLGPLERLAVQAFQPDLPVPDIFGAVLARWDAPENSGLRVHALADPYQVRLGGVRAYVVSFGDILAYVRAGRDRFPDELGACSLGATDRLRVVTRSFAESNDRTAMVHTVVLAERRHVEARRRREGRAR